MENLIRFDWAMKRLLRDKSNFVVLEGFLSVLLGEKITIDRFLESESNQDDANDKFNRADILAIDSKERFIIIEVQNNRELSYFHRMLYGVSKTVSEYINLGEDYDKVRKVYSKYASDIFPEYYVLKVNDFNKVAKTPLDEWMSFLKTGRIEATATAQGLPEARERLRVDAMPEAERRAYIRGVEAEVYQRSVLFSSWDDGRQEGLKEGLKEGIETGRAEEKRKIAADMKASGMEFGTIAKFTGLSVTEIEQL